MTTRWVGAWAFVLLAKLGVAASLGVLSDEAYHWVWAQEPALGYYDQPPLIAWVLAATAGPAPGALGLRWGPVIIALAGIAALVARTVDRPLAFVWMAGLPPLFLFTNLAVPDALLLGGWALALAGALAGGRGFLVTGLGAGLAGLAKPTAWVLLPLVVIALPPDERRSRWLAWAVGLNLLLLAPFVGWLLAHEGVTLTFQMTENLAHPEPPGAAGVLRQVVEQAMFATPFAFAAGLAFAVQWPRDRVSRLAWVTSVPVLVGFAGAAALGPPEAHWPAPAWLGLGVGVAASRGWRHRLAWLGALTGVAASGLIVVHAHRPLLRLERDPALRFVEGEVVARRVAAWALDEGAATGADGHDPVYTERYQEAASIQLHTGIVATVLPGCGRRSHYDLIRDQDFVVEPGWFVRPARSGLPHCAGRHFRRVVEVQELAEIDEHGRRVGPWDLWQVTP